MYDLNTYTISEQVKKKGEAGGANHLLANLKAKRDINKLGFSSNAPRFEAKKVEENERFLGPGYYE